MAKDSNMKMLSVIVSNGQSNSLVMKSPSGEQKNSILGSCQKLTILNLQDLKSENLRHKEKCDHLRENHAQRGVRKRREKIA